MTNNTSSSSANGTTEEPKPGQIGKHGIVKTYGSTSRPATHRAIDEFLSKYGVGGEQRMTTWEYRWWNARGRILHFLLNIHTLIAVEDWTRMPDGGVKIDKKGLQCWFCEYRET